MKYLYLIAICCAVVLLTADSAQAQTPFTVTVTATDGAYSTPLIVGDEVAATDCIDSSLGEAELPPLPPAGIFDARLLAPNGEPCFGQGVTTDIRHLNSDFQSDTFYVKLQRSTEATRPTFLLTWPSDIGTHGGGRWILEDYITGGSLVYIDMTRVDSAAVSQTDFYIIKSDTTSLRTFTMSDLAFDLNNKSQLEKDVSIKPVSVQFEMQLINATGGTVGDLHVELGVPMLDGNIDVSPEPTSSSNTKFQKYDFVYNTPLAAGDTVTISGFGLKAKLQTAKYWWLNGGVIVGGTHGKLKTTPSNFTMNILRNANPNTVNAGEGMMTALYPKGTLLVVGTTIPDASGYVHAVSHQKYTDVLKSLWNKKIGLQASNPSCLDFFDKSGVRNPKAPFKKIVKTLPPTKQMNSLFGEALVLKVNLGMSQNGNTPTGLGDLVVNDGGSLFAGETVSQVSAEMDTVLSCGTLAEPAKDARTFQEYVDAARQIDSTFTNTNRDTISFSGKTRFTGGQYLADVTFLARPAGASPLTIKRWLQAQSTTPEVYRLEQNYPNPFNPVTTIRFTLPEKANVTIAVYDLLGREVGTLADHQAFNSGTNEVKFDASHIASGVYFYRLTALDGKTGAMKTQIVKKMMVMK